MKKQLFYALVLGLLVVLLSSCSATWRRGRSTVTVTPGYSSYPAQYFDLNRCQWTRVYDDYGQWYYQRECWVSYDGFYGYAPYYYGTYWRYPSTYTGRRVTNPRFRRYYRTPASRYRTPTRRYRRTPTRRYRRTPTRRYRRTPVRRTPTRRYRRTPSRSVPRRSIRRGRPRASLDINLDTSGLMGRAILGNVNEVQINGDSFAESRPRVAYREGQDGVLIELDLIAENQEELKKFESAFEGLSPRALLNLERLELNSNYEGGCELTEDGVRGVCVENINVIFPNNEIPTIHINDEIEV